MKKHMAHLQHVCHTVLPECRGDVVTVLDATNTRLSRSISCTSEPPIAMNLVSANRGGWWKVFFAENKYEEKVLTPNKVSRRRYSTGLVVQGVTSAHQFRV